MLAVLSVKGEGSTQGFKMFSKGDYTGDGSLNLSKELENKISHSQAQTAWVNLGSLENLEEIWQVLGSFRKYFESICEGVLFLEHTSKVS